MIVDFSKLSTNQVYYTLIQTIIPRPVAWVLSSNGESSHDPYNLAPFSYFSGVSSNPPLVSLSIGRKPDGSMKDTALNIAERSYCVIHIPHRELAQKVTASSATLEYGQSELEGLDLELTEQDGWKLPRLAEARLAFYCKKFQIIEVGNTPQSLVLLDVLSLYVSKKIAKQDKKGRLSVDPLALDPLGRLGGQDYGLLGEVQTVPRPK